jgi:hypothetical protein
MSLAALRGVLKDIIRKEVDREVTGTSDKL